MSQAEAEHDEEAQTESTEADAEEVHDEEPTGADPNGEVDVATDETETLEADAEADEIDDEADADGDVDGISFIVEVDALQSVVDQASALVDEAKFQFIAGDGAGLQVRAVDAANVGMVDSFLAASAFEFFEANGLIALNINRLDDILGMANSGDLVQAELDQQTRKLDIQIGGLSYTMALIDPDSVRQRPDIPDLDLPVEISAEQSQFDHGLTAADMVSDHVRFRTPDSDDGVLNIEATGDTDETDLTLTSDDVIDHTSGDGDSLFDLSYLSDVFGPINKSDTVTVELGEEFPIKIHTSYADGLGNVTFMVAPRITDD